MSSQVCRFFLNNNCRYGDRCRFSHNLQERSKFSSNRYVYVRDDQNHSGPGDKSNFSSSEIRDIAQRVAEEAKQVEYEKMWPLTSLSVLKDCGNVPGWVDFSMEEIRSAAYSSKAAGRFQDYVQLYNSLKQKAKENRDVFIKGGRAAEEIVRNMFQRRNEASDHSRQNTPSAAFVQPLFGNASSGTASSFGTPFGSTPSIFGGSAAPNSQAVSFGSVPLNPTPGLFAMAAQGFNQSPFFQNTAQQSESMNETEMETAIDITSQSASGTSFSQNLFGQVPQQNQLPSVFQNAAPSQSAPGITTPDDIYTPMNALSLTDLQQFKATTFTLANLPLIPPPRELC